MATDEQAPVTALRRSCLAVPASNARMMAKAAGLAADEVFFDLEDACAPDLKEASRGPAAAALREHDFGEKLRAVRVNDLSTPWARDDIAEVVAAAGSAIDVVIVPKVEGAPQVEVVSDLLTGLEHRLGLTRRIALELLIESPRGAVNIREIAQASDRVAALIFGPGDYAASLGVPQREIGSVDERYPGHQWHWIMSEIAAHAKAVDAQAIDGPFADFNDEAGFRASAERARLLGFDGKWCIHPNQIPWANEAFSPTPAEVDAAERVVAAYAAALGESRAAIAVDGKLVDEASRKVAEAVLRRHRAAGPHGPPAA